MIEPTTLLATAGVSKAVGRSFSSVFQELHLTTEAWFEKTRLLTVGKRNYVDYMVNVVGVFPLFGTSRTVSVDETYVRVAVAAGLEREKYRPLEQIEEEVMYRQVGRLLEREDRDGRTPLQALQGQEAGFALIGNAGSGKTTAFRHIALEAARGIKIRKLKRIPFYFAVREMAIRGDLIRKSARDFLAQLGIGEAERVFHRLMLSGAALILLDGLDETDDRHQENLLKELEDLRGRYRSAILCVSARPYSLAVGLAGFEKWETLPLAVPERRSFVKKWFAAVDPNKGKGLLKKCGKKPEILDLGSNPLLLSIVCALYCNDLNLPSDEDELYSRAVEGLVGGWDAFRNIARKTPLARLTIRRRLVLLSWIAATLFDRGKIVFSARDVEATGCIKRAAAATREELPEADELLATLYSDFGILIERAPRLYSFSHLTIHEYLVAQYIVDNRTENSLLTAHWRKKEWFEVTRLVAKMLPRAANFLSQLHEQSRIESGYDMSLLCAVWRTRPVVSMEISLRLWDDLSKQVGKALRGISSRIAIGESVIRLRSTNKAARTDVAYDICRILPALAAAFHASGLRSDQLTKSVSPTLRKVLAIEARFEEVVLE